MSGDDRTAGNGLGLDDDTPVDEAVATVSQALAESDRDLQSDLLGGLTAAVLRDWTIAFEHVRPGVSVSREDNARLQQVRDFYEEQADEYEQLAAGLNVDSYRGLEAGEVLFMVDLRRLQDSLRDQLPADPNVNAVRLAELFNDRIEVVDAGSEPESVRSDELSDLRGHPVAKHLLPDAEQAVYRVSDPADRIRSILVHRAIPFRSEDSPGPGDVVFLHANGGTAQDDVTATSEGYIGCGILGKPVTGEQAWFGSESGGDTASLYSFRRLYLNGRTEAINLSRRTAELSPPELEEEIRALTANATRVGESAERSRERSDQLDETGVITESVVVFRTLRPSLIELPPVVVERPFDGWLQPEILSGLYFEGRRGERVLESIEAAWRTGKSVILTGPPGTGKTEIAERVLEYLQEAYPNYYTGIRSTTATADWSTFDTIGGYMPNRSSANDQLSFDPGLVTRCFRDERSRRRLNEPLLVDELNRADIDKAFGQLFTALTNKSVELSFRTDSDEPLRMETPERAGTVPDDEAYLLPRSWGLIATINSYDKTSLYEMSYAFMRRFSFVRVDPPTIPARRTERNELLAAYASAWGYDIDISTMEPPEATAAGRLLARLGELWHAVNTTVDNRAIGPAILKDMLDTIHAHREWQPVNGHRDDSEARTTTATGGIDSSEVTDHVIRQLLTDGVVSYVLPQLEGLPERKAIVTNVAATSGVNGEELITAARTSLDLPELTTNDIDREMEG